MKTLLIMAGGTGGHVIPALAVAENLRARGVRIIWMGTAQGIESTLVPKADIELKLVKVSGLRGSGLIRKVKAPFQLMGAAVQAMKIILSSKANAILGMGGFVSGPGGMVAWLLRKPLVLHEQNAIAGTTNRLLAPFAKQVLTGFESVTAFKHSEHIGNPVKPEIAAIEAPITRLARIDKTFNVLVIGGSQGALVFNEKLPKLLKNLQDELGTDIQLNVRHQSGKDKSDAVQQAYLDQNQNAEVHEFIDDMAAAYAWSDVLICRSGAMTVSEVEAAGAVAMFVPFPYAIDDHQFYNAKAMSDADAAICLRQDLFEKGEWVATLTGLAKNRDSLITMASKAREFARPDATAQLADICMEVMNA
ncbi:MAG: undecaprenyldiphospho-muramoylpentapeptide beta-N-acetylglucosaminyltransferase [Arenicellales bacterium]